MKELLVSIHQPLPRWRRFDRRLVRL